ncbi:MAG: hypothetical protein Q8P88_02985 [Candidatus Jorgensenbacteria bacterium]|nr:hypothetical protein [Candidatus Jorgensenbacteria bacterium]
MLKKYISFSLVVAVAVLGLSAVFVARTNAGAPADLPEQAGNYSVPGNPHLKLRVFVYHGKPDNPGKPDGKGNPKPPPPPPSEVCEPTVSADPDSNAVVNGAGWTLPSAWTYHLNVGSVPGSVGSANLATIAGNSFAAWLSADPSVGQVVDVVRGSDTSMNRAQLDGENIVVWGRTSGSALAVSYVWYNTITHQAVEVDTIMNKKFSWEWSDPNTWPAGQTCAYEGAYDAQNIMVHEFGHTFGLDDEYASAYTHNTMYGYGATSETKKDTLTSGDRVGVGVLY